MYQVIQLRATNHIVVKVGELEYKAEINLSESAKIEAELETLNHLTINSPTIIEGCHEETKKRFLNPRNLPIIIGDATKLNLLSQKNPDLKIFIARAIEIISEGKGEMLSYTEWKVKGTSPKDSYRVWLKETWRCECPHFKHSRGIFINKQKICKHILSVIIRRMV